MMKTLTHNIYRVVLLAFIVLCIGLSHSYAQFYMGNSLAPLPGSLYPIVFANDAKGGHHQVADIATRDLIPSLRRIQGMLCTVLDAGSGTPKTYQLLGGILNTNWVVFAPGGSALSTVATSGSFSDLTGKPTTVAGYGILDAMTTAHPANVITAANITDWGSAYTGRISSVSGTAPLLLSLSLNVLTASMPAATSTSDGYATAAQITAIGANTLAVGSNTTAISNEVIRATGIEGTNATAILANTSTISNEVTRATGIEGTNATANLANTNAISNEVTRATGIEGTNATAIAAEATIARTAEITNTNAIALKANIDSPVFTGNPTASTPLSTDVSNSLATTAFVTSAVSAATIPDATTVVKGKILLAGDFAGNADLPVIADGKVTTTKIADANITTSKILDANITTSKIADANITTLKILDANVTTSKLADANITYAKIQQVTPSSLLGNPTTSAAPVSEITLGTGLSMTGNVLNTTGSGVAGTFTADIIVRTANGLGKYLQNAIIPAIGKTANEVLIDAFSQTIPPTYVGPTATMTTAVIPHEIGETFTVNLSSSFTPGNAGANTGTIYSKGVPVSGTPLGAGVISDIITSITSNTSYYATVAYAQGACLNNNLGAQDCSGRIAAGSVTSAAITFTASAKRYWGRSSGVPNSATIIAGAGGGVEFSGTKVKTGFSVTASGSNNIYFAYPATLLALTAISVGGFDSFPAFTQNTVSFTNASGYVQSYFVYVSNNTFSGDATNINVQ